MPRSPSPPPRYPLPTRRYRDESSPRFQPRREQGERSWGDHHRRRRDLDRDLDDDRPYRPPPRERYRERNSPVKSVHASEGKSGTPEEGQITSPPRNPGRLPPRPRSPPPLVKRRSPSPLSYRRRSPSPLPYRRRSPSPGPYRRRSPSPAPYRRRSPSPPPLRRRSPSPPPFRRRSPSPSYRRRSPSPRAIRYSPAVLPPRRRSPSPRFRSPRARPLPRSPSPSSISSRSRSSRYASPEKRGSRQTSSSPASRRPPFDPLPPPPIKRDSPLARPPPAGPKSYVIPTGPRALTGTAALPLQPLPNQYPSPVTIKEEASAPVPVPIEVNSSYGRVPPPMSAGGGTPRLSWSERKSLVSPSAPVVESSTVNPYTIRRQPSDLGVKVESPFGGVRQNTEQIKVEVAPPSNGRQASYTAPQGRQSEEILKVESTIKEERKEEKPLMSDAEVAELRRRQVEARILAELPTLKVSHIGAQWEMDLANHYRSMAVLQQNTLRAQSAARHAAAVLADAEAERLAAVERRKVVEAQLVAGSLGVSGVGIMGS